MGRVTYPLQQPDTNMDGVSLDSFLTDMQTETASLDGVNFRDRGFDQRAAADNLVAELLFTPIVHKARAAQGLTAGAVAALAPGSTSFETAFVALDQYDVVELEASIYVSAQLSSTQQGRLAGDKVLVWLQRKVGTGGAWTDIAGSKRALGCEQATVSGQYGANEPEGHHGTLHPFAVYTDASAGAIAEVKFRIVVQCNSSSNVYFEDCTFYGLKLRRV